MNKIILIGASGHAKVIIDIIERDSQSQIIGLIDNDAANIKSVLGYPVLGQDQDLPVIIAEHKMLKAIIALGDNYRRSQIATQITKLCPDIQFATAIHPSANIARNVVIGAGTVVMAGASINTDCAIGKHCIINTNASLDHDSVMEDFSSLAPHSGTGGNCHLGFASALNIGAIIANGVTIGNHSIMAAGALALESMPANKLLVGTPAKIARERQPGEKYL